MIKNVVVLGAGSAGLAAALTLKRTLPMLAVRIIRSPDIGVIGVGEGTTPYFRWFLFDFLRLDPNVFYREAQPIWKLGIRFLWGPRRDFGYPFGSQFDHREPGLSKDNGFYCEESCADANFEAALMGRDRVCVREADGRLTFPPTHAFHLENQRLVAYLEARVREAKVEIIDATVNAAETSGEDLAAVLIDSGERVTADLFIDASGFRSEMLGRVLGEPFHDFSGVLFCDRAIIAGWSRDPGEAIQPYTTTETMDAGWCWRIDHEHFINRGYVFSSGFCSDEEGLAEFLRKNPKIAAAVNAGASPPRVVKFRAGRYARSWVGNVIALGNSAGFVEPLEATALTVLAQGCHRLAEILFESRCDPQPAMRGLYNFLMNREWDGVRDFLAIHYRFNTLFDTPFWQMAREETPLGAAAEFVKFYEENGPCVLSQHVLGHAVVPYGLDGYLTMLVGQRVPYRQRVVFAPKEIAAWETHRAQNAAHAAGGLTAVEALAAIRQPEWRWNLPDRGP